MRDTFNYSQYGFSRGSIEAQLAPLHFRGNLVRKESMP